MKINPKPFDQMTLDELRRERDHWDEIIRNSMGWNSAIALAEELRLGCDAMIARRERQEGDRPGVPHALRSPEPKLAETPG